MTARVLTIEERRTQAPGVLASLADFTWVEGEEVNPAVVVENPNVSLYCFDDATRRAIFAQLPPGTDLTKSPFVYRMQNEQAERLIAVSYDVFLQQAVGLRR